MGSKYVFTQIKYFSQIALSIHGSAFLSEFSVKEYLKYNDVLSAVFTVVSDLTIQTTTNALADLFLLHLFIFRRFKASRTSFQSKFMNATQELR